MDEQEQTTPPTATARIGADLDTVIAMFSAERIRLSRKEMRRLGAAARAARGYDDRPVLAETQHLVNGRPAIVSELAEEQRSQRG